MSEAATGSGHQPVLEAEVLAGLQAGEPGEYLDATFGGGGHTRAILRAHPHNQVLGLDRDPAAAGRAARLEREEPGRFRFRAMNFGEMDVLGEAPRFDGILFDLGVSSYQLDEGERGFSFREDAPVDMRMDPSTGRSGAEFLEEAEREELVRAVRDLGEEPFWRRVVDALLGARGTGQLGRTGTLAELVAGAIPAAARRRLRIHPATRTFQGIRLAVNGELEALERALPASFGLLKEGGRLAVISFHSLEDRRVKRFFREKAGRPVSAEDSRPQDERVRVADLPGRQPVRPGSAEEERNPRSRSARLRVLVRREEGLS